MALIRNYGFTTKLDTGKFDFSFEIPNNCNYTTAYDAAKNYYTVSIQSNPGQTQTSNTYIKQTYTFSAVTTELNVNFEQKLNGTTETKPKVKISEI